MFALVSVAMQATAVRPTLKKLPDRGTQSRTFPAGSRRVQVGVRGGRFNTVLSGHQTMPGPPNAWFAGYTLAGSRR